ncbi:MAG: hypothetical protein EXS64_10565 [Candidatus Latescibacteria bacterium]|nr:hypothetical protein [Candidatus Latescibacterota bacterium]
MGTQVLSEWPYTAISLLFLYFLILLKEGRRNIPFAVLTGVLLGMASLTRWLGVLLGVAVLAQSFDKMRSGRGLSRFRLALPEAVVAVTGAGIFGLWVATHVQELQMETQPADNVVGTMPLPFWPC